MSWYCSECDRDVLSVDSEKKYIWVGEEGIGWLCGQCRGGIEWRPLLDMYDDDGTFIGSNS